MPLADATAGGLLVSKPAIRRIRTALSLVVLTAMALVVEAGKRWM
jgi:hypothetical protein